MLIAKPKEKKKRKQRKLNFLANMQKCNNEQISGVQYLRMTQSRCAARIWVKYLCQNLFQNLSQFLFEYLFQNLSHWAKPCAILEKMTHSRGCMHSSHLSKQGKIFIQTFPLRRHLCQHDWRKGGRRSDIVNVCISTISVLTAVSRLQVEEL